MCSSDLLCPDYVIRRPVYKSDPLYGLDLSLLLKSLTLQTLQRYPVPRVHPGSPIARLRPRMDSDKEMRPVGWIYCLYEATKVVINLFSELDNEFPCNQHVPRSKCW